MIDILYVFISAFLSIFNIPLFVDTFNGSTISITLGSLIVFSIIISVIYFVIFKANVKPKSKGGDD